MLGYAYDGFDRLGTAAYPDTSTEVYSYDADSNPLTRKTRKGDTITLTYDTLNRLSTKAAPSEATVTYAYDQASHLTGVSDTSAAVAAVATEASYATTYAYDAMNRPVGASWSPATTQTAPAQASVSFTHAYDANNRRIGQTASDKTWLLYPAGASTTAYTANALNQYTAVGSAAPAYDGNGNLTSDGTLTYAYDAESRLGSVKQGGTTLASYAYDAQSRRKSKTVGSTTTLFVTDADNREVLEYDGTSGAVQRWYSQGPGLNAALNQMNVAAGTRTTLIPDIQGSVIATLDSGTGALTKAAFLPYGENPTTTTGTFRYAGARIDPETGGTASQPSGLYYMRARMYSPTWGRFLQPDPIGYGGGANLYAYAGDDPLNNLDLFGLYNCGGQLCPPAIVQAISGIGASVRTQDSVSAAASVSSIASELGSNSTNSGPTIFIGGVPSGANGGTNAQYPGGVINISSNLVTGANNPLTPNVMTVLSGLIGHETQHIIDSLENGGNPTNVSQEVSTETNAYTSEGYIVRSLEAQGWAATGDPTTPDLGSTPDQIQAGIGLGVSQSTSSWLQGALNYNCCAASPGGFGTSTPVPTSTSGSAQK